MKCCSLGATASVFGIQATLRSAGEADCKRYSDCALCHQQECDAVQAFSPEELFISFVEPPPAFADPWKSLEHRVGGTEFNFETRLFQ